MKPLYLSECVRQGLGSCLRPGGEALTRRALECVRPGQEDVVLDAGAGMGATLSLLKDAGISKLFGVDLELSLLGNCKEKGFPAMQGDLAHLPIASDSIDTIFCECVWNLTDKDQVLTEFNRVLRPGGTLVLSDIYLRSQNRAESGCDYPVRSCFTFATDLETVKRQVTNHGFELQLVEDHSLLLKQTAAEFVFAHGSLQGFWQAVTGDERLALSACDAASTTRPSLFLLIAKRSAQ